MTHTHPVPDVEETLLIGQVEHQQEAHGISEESCSEAAEPKSGRTAFVIQHEAAMCRFLTVARLVSPPFGPKSNNHPQVDVIFCIDIHAK